MSRAVLGLVEWMYARMNDLFGWLVSLGLSGKLKWVARDWIAFVIGIVLFGLVIDGIVYFVRYRPDRRWKQLLRRLGARRKETPVGEILKEAPPPAERQGIQPTRARRQQEPETMPKGRLLTPDARPTPTVAMPRGGVNGSTRVGENAPPHQPTRRKAGPSSAELFQPAPPMEGYDGEPSTYQPEKKTPDWKRPET